MWTEDDQDLVIGFRREQHKVCQGCGTRKDEWEEDRFAYVAQTTQCPGCELISQEQANVPRGAEGTKTFLIPREVAEAEARARVEAEADD